LNLARFETAAHVIYLKKLCLPESRRTWDWIALRGNPTWRWLKRRDWNVQQPKVWKVV